MNQCEDVVEPQFRETCTDNFVNNCENVIETFNRNICNFVNQTVCEQVEETWYKDECQYEVVYEEVCSVNYVTVRYKTECQYEVELPQETGQDPESTAQVFFTTIFAFLPPVPPVLFVLFGLLVPHVHLYHYSGISEAKLQAPRSRDQQCRDREEAILHSASS